MRAEVLAAQNAWSWRARPINVKSSCGKKNHRRAGLSAGTQCHAGSGDRAGNGKTKLAVLGAGASVGKPLARYEIRAPIDGVVAEKYIAIGEALKEDAPIFTITDLSRVWAEAVVSAKDLPRLQTGQKATVKASAYDASGSGTLTYVGALIGEQSRTATARIVLDNHRGCGARGYRYRSNC